MINLLETYNRVGQDLIQSIKAAGYQHKTVVLEDDGFLPEEIESPLKFFLDRKANGKARYFNQLDVPYYWEIRGDGRSADIYDGVIKRAHIRYAGESTAHERVIASVEWLNGNEKVRQIDYYDQYGHLYAKATYSDGELASTSYFDESMREVIIVNHLTKVYLVNYQQKKYILTSQLDFYKLYLKLSNLNIDRIIYNTLATAHFLVEDLMGRNEQGDILFWEEKLVDNKIPGNMANIMTNRLNTQTIVFQIKADYDVVKAMGVTGTNKIKYAGFIYQFKKTRKSNNDCLIMTNSDDIEQLDNLVKHLPEVSFHIGALTTMSDKLVAVGNNDNVSLYANISLEQREELWQKCQVYLDINHGDEILDGVRTAFDHEMVVLGFNNTCHNRQYISGKNIFDGSDYLGLSDQLKQIISDHKYRINVLNAQKRSAGMDEESTYEKVIG